MSENIDQLNLPLDEYQKSILVMIQHDVDAAYQSKNPDDIKLALSSVKRIKKANGELDLAVMQYLKGIYDMKFVWGTVDEATHKEKRLALVYNGMAFQID